MSDGSSPFTPGFGTSPASLVGREQLVGKVGRAFSDAINPQHMKWLREVAHYVVCL